MIWVNLAPEEIQLKNMKEEEEECFLKSDICEDVENRIDRIRNHRCCCVQIYKVLIKTENVRKYFLRSAEKIVCNLFLFVRNIFCNCEDFVRLE